MENKNYFRYRISGEKEKFLKVILSFNKPGALETAFNNFFEYDESTFEEILLELTEDSFTRLIFPSIEREVRNQFTEISDVHAIEIFASNLKQLLLLLNRE